MGKKRSQAPEPTVELTPIVEKRIRKPKTPTDGARVNINVQGTPAEAASALDRMSGGNGTPGRRNEEQPEQEADGRSEQLEKFLNDPKNVVIVKRQTPGNWNGVKTDIELHRYDCPIGYDTIISDTFERFGGHRFVATIHPKSSAGVLKVLEGFDFTNTGMTEPLFEGQPIGELIEDDQQEDPRGVGRRASRVQQADPYAQEDPAALVAQIQKDNLLAMRSTIATKQIQKQLRDLQKETDDEEGDGRRRKGSDEQDRKILELQKKLDDQQLEQRITGRIDQLAGLVEKVLTQPQRPANGEGNGQNIILKFMESQSATFTKLIETMSTNTDKILGQMSKKEPVDEDKILDRIARMKAVFGPSEEGAGGGSRVRRIEDLMYEMAMERITGGASATAEEDSVKYAVRELSPILKTYVEKKMEADALKSGQPVSQMSQEQLKAAYEAAGRATAKDIVNQMIASGQLIVPGIQTNKPPGIQQQPPAGAKPAVPSPNPAPTPSPTPGPTQNNPPPAAKPGDQIEEKEEDDMNLPPGPTAINYDRKQSVEFILDEILSDIAKGLPENSFVMGDALDRLDDEILGQIASVDSGDELEKILTPWGSAEKIAAIKKAGENPNVKGWLKGVVTTIGQEYRKQTGPK